MVEAAHWAAVAPVAYLILWHRDAPAAAWLMALGFLASWFADSLAYVLGGSWVVSYLLPPVQFGLFAAAFRAYWVVFALLVLAAYQVTGPMEGPEIMVTLAGSVAVLAYSVGRPLGVAMVAYCGVGTVCYMVMASGLWADTFMPTWYAYQGSRSLAFAAFCWSINNGV